MKLTIITVVYNDVTEIQQTIQSVLNQDFKDYEYIIIDGGSTDGTKEIVEKYSSFLSYWVSEKDNGMYDALNKGIQKAKADWIGILNSGDIFYDDSVLTRVSKYMNQNNVGVLYGNSVEVFGERKISHKATIPPKGSRIPPGYRHGASFVRSDIHKSFLFDLSMKRKYGYGLDYLQIYTMYKNGIVFSYINESIIYYKHEGMSSHPWQNLYTRTLTESDGVVGLRFFIIYVQTLLGSLFRKIKRICQKIRHE